MTIHHATAKRAEKLGFTITEAEDGTFTIAITDEVTTSPATDAKAALAEAVRIRDLIDSGEYDPEAEDGERSASIVKPKYRKLYKERGDATCCGDDMSAEFKNFVTVQDEKGRDQLDLSALREVAVDNGLVGKLEEWQARGLNNGQQRMNLGNMLRKKFRDGESVKFGTFTMVPEFDDNGELV